MVPPVLLTLLTPFESLFRRPSWIKVQTLLAGAILLTGRRTVTQVLMKRLNVAGAPKSKHEASIVMPCVLHQTTLSKPAGYVG